jgi:hypothetical protein
MSAVEPLHRITINPTPFNWIDSKDIPARNFIYGGHYIREFLSLTVAASGVGKSSLSIVEALAIVTGRPLLGVEPRETAPVWYFNGEDPAVELRHRFNAAMQHYGIPHKEVAGRLFFDSGRKLKIKLAEINRGVVTVNDDAVDAIIRAIRTQRIGVMILDPFATMHKVTENLNGDMETVAETIAYIASETGIAIDVVHHARKTNGLPVTLEDARGASAVLAKARSGRTLNSLSDKDAGAGGVEPKEFFAVEYEKSSMKRPRRIKYWHRLAGVALANGDEVGVATATAKPDALANVGDGDLAKAQAAIAEGQWRADCQAKAWGGIPIGAALGIDAAEKDGKAKVNGMIRAWAKAGHFVFVERVDEKSRKRRFMEPHTSQESPPPPPPSN